VRSSTSRIRQKTASALRDGYFTAGDIGYLDADGYLFLNGRSAELIISGGVNIYPQEIDDVLAQHRAVADVACVGVPDEDLGEEVRAVVELRAGFAGDDAMRQSLLDFCAERLAKQKWPRSIDFIVTLPRSPAGKVLRSALRQEYWAGRSRQI
jgi:long-chain acyl-CoA synthetase